MHPPLTAGEEEAAIRRTRMHACVVGPLKPTVLKHLAQLMAPILADILCACARVGRLPWRWAVSCISLIPKPKADTSTCDSHWGIIVSTLPAKLYAAILDRPRPSPDRHIQNWAEKAGLRIDAAQWAIWVPARVQLCPGRTGAVCHH